MPNIVNALMTYVRNTKGKYNYFSQSAYMRKYGWSGTDRTKLGGVWTGATGKKDIQGKEIYGLGGACYGFSAAYLISPPHSCNVENYFHLPKTQSIIRGVMNLQYQHYHVALAYTSLPREEIFNEIVRIEGHIRYRGMVRLSRVSASALMNELVMNGKHEINMVNASVGHSVALKIAARDICFFDSNLGEIIYPNDFFGRKKMEGALHMVFHSQYRTYTTMSVSNFI